MASSSQWQRFQSYFLDYRDLGFSLDISRMKFPDDFFEKMQPKIDKAFGAMLELEAGAIANPTEKRMVGHYWLRYPALGPTAEIRKEIEDTLQRIKRFAEDVHAGKITGENGKRFEHVLHIGIGGSALGPQLVADALGSARDRMDIHFFDNTDPDGFDRVFEKIDDLLPQMLVVVVSKSGGTKETRNGMLETEAKFAAKGLQFPRHAVAVTGVGSDLDRQAHDNGWLARFPMFDWIGGRTSVMSAVGLLPMALEGFDIDNFLAGAAAMYKRTRAPAVYGNKGSTDQHAYVQQLRDGVLNFFITFIEVRKDRRGERFDVEDGITSGDYLEGFLRGTRSALYESGRESITISIPEVNAFNLGMLIALYERAVGFYGSLVNINAYDQPGVEAGKKAATKLLQLQKQVSEKLLPGRGQAAEEIARAIDADPEDVFHVLRHLATNNPQIKLEPAEEPADDRFSFEEER